MKRFRLEEQNSIKQNKTLKQLLLLFKIFIYYMYADSN